MDDQCNEPKIYDSKTLSFEIYVQNTPKPEEEITKLPSPLSPILKKSNTEPTNHVTATSMPVNVAERVCLENDTPTSPREEEQNSELLLPPQPQAAPVTQHSTNNDDETLKCPALHHNLDVMKKFIQHDKEDVYIPLMSAITIKKKDKCFSYPWSSIRSKSTRWYTQLRSSTSLAKGMQKRSGMKQVKAPPTHFKSSRPTQNLNQLSPHTRCNSRSVIKPLRKRS